MELIQKETKQFLDKAENLRLYELQLQNAENK